MRCLASVTLAVAACSFTPGGDPPGHASDGGNPGMGHDAPAMITPDACPDADHDGVCDAVDKCPGADDHVDSDGDGIPDGCDDWPCGLRPGKPDDPLIYGAYNHLQSVAGQTLDGNGRLDVATTGNNVVLGFGYGLSVDCNGFASQPPPTCRVQIEVGLGTSKIGCILDGFVTSGQGYAGTANGMFPAPSPGLYEVRVSTAVDSGGCSGDWTNGTPSSSQTIAYLCVH